MKYNTITSSFAASHDDPETLCHRLTQNVKTLIENGIKKFEEDNIVMLHAYPPSISYVSHNGVLYGTVVITVISPD